MTAWVSPFPLTDKQRLCLTGLGWLSCIAGLDEQKQDCVGLYDSPDALLAIPGLDADAILAGYQDLLAYPHECRLIPMRLLAPDESCDPLRSALSQVLISRRTDLLDAYLDLELRADLQGSDPDLNYSRRLWNICDPTAIVTAWHALTDSHQSILDLSLIHI